MITIETPRLKLVSQTREEVTAYVAQMEPRDRAQVSAGWLEALEGSAAMDPWLHGFKLVNRSDQKVVGRCGFKGPPEAGVVEIGYGIAAVHQGNGYATEAAEGLVRFAAKSGAVSVVRAHTLPEPNASTRVLTKAGFQKVGEVMDPEDGLVWRWEKPLRSTSG